MILMCASTSWCIVNKNLIRDLGNNTTGGGNLYYRKQSQINKGINTKICSTRNKRPATGLYSKNAF